MKESFLHLSLCWAKLVHLRVAATIAVAAEAFTRTNSCYVVFLTSTKTNHQLINFICQYCLVASAALCDANVGWPLWPFLNEEACVTKDSAFLPVCPWISLRQFAPSSILHFSLPLLPAAPHLYSFISDSFDKAHLLCLFCVVHVGPLSFITAQKQHYRLPTNIQSKMRHYSLRLLAWLRSPCMSVLFED